MKISKISIVNFRGFEEETIHFGNYTSLVGPGGAGKSTALTALRIFFRDTADTATDLQALGEEDFHDKDTTKDVVITVEFTDLDEEAQKELQHYYRYGKLVVSAVAHWDEAAQKAEVLQFGQRLGLGDFGPFFLAEKAGKSATELQQIYEGLRSRFTALPQAKIKARMMEALHAYESEHEKDLILIPSSDQFYGFTKGESLLKRFIQWVFVPAVKDASTENIEGKKNALSVLLERTVRSKISFDDQLKKIRTDTEQRYREILNEQREILQGLSKSLAQRLAQWAHPSASLTVEWDEDASRYVDISEPLARVIGREGTFEGDLSRFGHGFQRSYLLALLQELAGCQDTGNPRLILACEEPELHQHPPQARHLAGVLQELSEKNSQVIASSHSPYFVRGATYEDVRLIRYEPKSHKSCVSWLDMEKLSNEIAHALGDKPVAPNAQELKVEQCLQERIGELFFSPSLVLVEGLEDAGYLETYLTLLDMREGLRKMGCHILHTGGKNEMIRPLAIAKILKIPTFAIFDADGDEKDKDTRANNERLNTAVLRLCGVEPPNPFPTGPLVGSNIFVWPTTIGSLVRSEIGDQNWGKFAAEVTKQKAMFGVSLHKNRLYIGFILSEAWAANAKSASLQEACRAVMSFAIRAAAAQKQEG